MVANMAALEALDKAINEHDSSTSESVTGSVDSVQRMPDLVENVNGSGTNSMLDEPNKSKVYASVSEMKRMKVISSVFPRFLALIEETFGIIVLYLNRMVFKRISAA